MVLKCWLLSKDERGMALLSKGIVLHLEKIKRIKSNWEETNGKENVDENGKRACIGENMMGKPLV